MKRSRSRSPCPSSKQQETPEIAVTDSKDETTTFGSFPDYTILCGNHRVRINRDRLGHSRYFHTIFTSCKAEDERSQLKLETNEHEEKADLNVLLLVMDLVYHPLEHWRSEFRKRLGH